MTPNQPSPKRLYAHSLPNQPEKRWQTLDAYLKTCAEVVQDATTAFSSGLWGKLLGDMLDASKAHVSFQKWPRQKEWSLTYGTEDFPSSHS